MQIDLSTATQKLVLCGPSPAAAGSTVSTTGQVAGVGYPGTSSLPPTSPPLQLWEPVADLSPGNSSDDTLHYDVKELGLHTCAFSFLLLSSAFSYHFVGCLLVAVFLSLYYSQWKSMYNVLSFINACLRKCWIIYHLMNLWYDSCVHCDFVFIALLESSNWIMAMLIIDNLTVFVLRISLFIKNNIFDLSCSLFHNVTINSMRLSH